MINSLHINEYDGFFIACEIVAKRQKIKLIRPPLIADSGDFFDFIKKIADTSGIRLRKVALSGQWWKKDGGPLLGFYQGRPCALIPKKTGGYQLIDVKQRHRLKVSAAVAEKISAYAFCFYPPLPGNIRKLSEFFNFSLSQVTSDFRLFAGIQLLFSLLILTIPLAISYLFNIVIPDMDFGLLWQIIALLFVNILVLTLFRIVQTAARIRLRFKLNAVTAPAIWDKILKLPLRFFQRFSAGDLTFRAGVITDIQNTLTQSYLLLLAGGVNLIFTLILLFYYNSGLATVAAALALVIISVILAINFRQLKFMGRVYYHFGRFVGFVFELIAGITKIRVTNAMSRVFEIWSNRLATRSAVEVQTKFYSLGMEVFIALMVVINPLILYALAMRLGAHLSFGDFVAFNVAYAWFFMTLFTMTSDLGEVMRTLPLWKQSRIIFTAKAEREVGYSDPGELSGDIVLKNIVFRYHAYDQPLFKDLTLSIRPGEFVAIVGPSGSGKSTLFRLMLGFEEPEAGEVYYNGLNLRTLKLSAVRRQIGVVVQNSTLIPGTIFANIAGNSLKMTRLDAWEIAEKVGLAELIKQLPMQMDTLITEGAITLSGGEVQRLILARALAQQPKLLLLDEATSALDNTTQAVVHHYLKQLQATQIIAAHRLSTIVNANRIIVMDKGAIAQMGTFNELISQPGLFAQMAKRQL